MKARAFLVTPLITLLSLPASGQVSTDWTSVYDGPPGLADYSYTIAIDDSGNVYSAGESPQVSTSDMIVLKYNAASGDTLWVRTYNGPGNSRDVARALAVDDSGNVFVAGESIGSGTGFDLVVVKYNAAGAEQWARRYNGPANGDDGASGLGLDASGNVYVTGYSDGDASPVFRSDDYITIKYNAAGTLQWARRYSVGGDGNAHDYAKAVAVDASGNCYVTGRSSYSGSGYDYLTIRYSTTGDSLWTRRYNGTGNNTDDPYDIALDADGNIYVTGTSRGTSNDDYLTIKYSPTGDPLWTHRYEGPGGPDAAYRLVVDQSGNVYVTGQSRRPGTGFTDDYLTIKYDPQGDTLWTARYDGPRDSTDVPVGLALDGEGNVYVTGYSVGIGTAFDFATVKYSPQGNEDWVARFATPGYSSDIATGVAVDAAGHVYVTGRGTYASQFLNIVTIRYSQGPASVFSPGIPSRFHVAQNYPNPFNPTTHIAFEIPARELVTLTVYDLLGREVALLINDFLEPGSHTVPFDGSGLATGTYFYRLVTGSRHVTGRMMLMK